MSQRILFFIFILFSISCQAAHFSDVVVFGDSLSDNGNLYSATAHIVPKSPPYYQGHFTNGPVWIEDVVKSLTGDLSKLDDYAVGGASAVFHLQNSKLPYSLAGEMTLFDIENVFTDHSHTLFVIWAGGNDYLVDPSDKAKSAKAVVDKIASEIEHLINKHDARYFLIPNLPDLSVAPQARQLGIESDLQQLTTFHNQYLAEKIESLQTRYADKGVILVPLDVHALFDDVLRTPDAYGIRDVVNPCYGGSIFDSPFGLQSSEPNSAALMLHGLDAEKRAFILDNPALRAAVSAAADYEQRSKMYSLHDENACDGKLFWDDVHPTRQVHAQLAERALAALSSAGVYFEKG